VSVSGSHCNEAPEGRLLERKHFARERDRGLRAKKIAKHLKAHQSLSCATCGFDFKAAYGSHGDGYIECHHVVPLYASGEVKTRLDDLILICANCHPHDPPPESVAHARSTPRIG
jgi:5-methylcytosine-specific restriction protein A